MKGFDRHARSQGRLPIRTLDIMFDRIIRLTQVFVHIAKPFRRTTEVLRFLFKDFFVFF